MLVWRMSLLRTKSTIISWEKGERGGSVVECRTPEREVRGSRPTSAVLCPWARHFTPRKYWLITQEAMAPSRHDWKIVDWDVKPQHNQPTREKRKENLVFYMLAFTGLVRPPMMVGNMMRPVAPPASFPNPIQRPGLQQPRQQRPTRPPASSSAPVTTIATSVSMKDLQVS